MARISRGIDIDITSQKFLPISGISAKKISGNKNGTAKAHLIQAIKTESEFFSAALENASETARLIAEERER